MFRRLLAVLTLGWIAFSILMGLEIGVFESDPDAAWLTIAIALIPPAAIWFIFYGDELY